MARFRYRAVGNDGTVSEDVVDAPDLEAAIAQLRSTEHLPVEVTPDGEVPDVASLASRMRRRVRPPSREAYLRFTRELATMIAADVSVDRALEILAQSAGSNALSDVAGMMRMHVREGQSLAQAAAAHPNTFSPFYCATLRAGEAGGRLAAALTSLARYQERMAYLVNAVQSALIYPTLLALAALVSLVILLVYVVPQFDQLFREAAATLPWGTRAVIGVSRFTIDYGWLILLFSLGIWLYLRMNWHRLGVRVWLDKRVLRLPVVGDVVRRLETERFAHALGALLRNGVLLPDALALTADSARSAVFVQTVRRSIKAVKGGSTLAAALARGSAFPVVALELVRVGEEGGRLVEMLDGLAMSNATETETAIKRFVAILEPSLIVAIGVVVGAIILSLVSAIAGINALAF